MPSRIQRLTRIHCLASLLGVIGLADLTSPAWPAAAPHPSQTLQASLVEASLSPRPGTPLAGFGSARRRILPWDVLNRYPYATFFKPGGGSLDPLRVKVLYLQKGDQRLVFVSADLIAIPSHLRQDVLTRLSTPGLNDDQLVLSATHTHSGPGALSRNWLYGLVFFDQFQQPVYDDLVHTIAFAIQKAAATSKPADLYSHSFIADGLQKNRTAADGPVDKNANLLLIRSQQHQSWLGGIVNYAIHPTALSSRSARFSADVSGAMERQLETVLARRNQGPQQRLRPVVLFINGSMGDITPRHRDAAGIERTGRDFAALADRSLEQAQPLTPAWSVASTRVALGAPFGNLPACLKNPILRRLARLLRIGLGAILPDATTISSIRIGTLAMTTVPGEPTTSLGRTIQAHALQHGATQAWILGTTNDYLGYFVTADEYKRNNYEACTSFYGERGGQQLAAAAAQTIRQLNSGLR